MNWLDIVIIVLITWFSLTSLMSGIVREALTLVGFVLGIYLAGQYYPKGAEYLEAYVSDPNLANVLGFLGILLAVWIAVSLLALALRRVARLLFLGWADHLGGMVFGFLKGTVIIEGLLMLLAKFPILGLATTISQSKIATFALHYAPFLLTLFPQEFKELTHPLLQGLYQ